MANRNRFRLTRFIIFYVSPLFRFLSKTRNFRKRLLIIKLDEIGDYVLFRNFIKVLKTSAEYNDYQIDLVGNLAWRELAEKYDGEFITNFYFLSPKELLNRPLELLSLGYTLFRNNYAVVLQPTYARTLWNDAFAGLASGKLTIGFFGDVERIHPKYKSITDKFYSSKLILPKEILFEFYRNKFFFESLLKTDIGISKPSLEDVSTIKDNYVIIFPGAGSEKRKWGNDNFLRLINLILKSSNYGIVIAGGRNEIADEEFFLSRITDSRVSSQVNKTSLPELVTLIAESACVITNDTSAVHIAAACNTPCLCIHGVAHYKRFIPYPPEIANNMEFVYQEMVCQDCNWNCIYNLQDGEAYPCITINDFETVVTALKRLIILS